MLTRTSYKNMFGISLYNQGWGGGKQLLNIQRIII